jgi:hypothetical protein
VVAVVLGIAMLARDGIEPPTPAFSGLDSTRAIVFENGILAAFSVPVCAHLLDATPVPGFASLVLVGFGSTAKDILARDARNRCASTSKPTSN